MKKLFAAIVLLGSAFLGSGCARPGEIGYTPAYTADERGRLIARNWDYEGKQAVDDFDDILLLRPMGHLTQWNLR